MNISQMGGPIIAFTNVWPSGGVARSRSANLNDAEWIGYWRARELAERAAAKQARSAAARCVHQQLAQAYAGLVQGAQK